MTVQRDRGRIDRPAADRLPAVIESLLFVAEEPQEIGTLAKSLNVPRQGVEQAIETLAASVNGRGLLVQRFGDRVQLATAPDAAPYIEQFLEVEHGRLSRASLESLAVIAYRQPVTRAGVEAIRGVNSDHAVATLLARGLIEDVGRAPGPGRPVLFGTTVRFLEYFGLERPQDLPPLAEPVSDETPEPEQPQPEDPVPVLPPDDITETIEP
jgi:segregation and condensation protein B